MVFIYALALKNNKYYIGKTNNPSFRLKQHFDSNGSTWTKKYQPLKLLELKSSDDNYDEDKYTLKYMEKHGINNVRGGSFCETKLSEENKITIQKMISGTTDKCYVCGKKGHFANKCTDDFDKLIVPSPKQKKCFRCHRTGHYADNCYAKTYDNAENIDDSDDEYIEVFQCNYCHKEFDTYKGATYHENMYCTEKKRNYSSKKKCNKCGRDSHYTNQCFASTHKKGYNLS
jgi:predicted GIY-YIG superfamily endonuclease